MVRGELNPAVWSRERTVKSVRDKLGSQLPAIKKKLLFEGDSREREATFDLIDRERIAFVMDASFFEPLRECASDKESNRSSSRGRASIALRSRWAAHQP